MLNREKQISEVGVGSESEWKEKSSPREEWNYTINKAPEMRKIIAGEGMHRG